PPSDKKTASLQPETVCRSCVTRDETRSPFTSLGSSTLLRFPRIRRRAEGLTAAAGGDGIGIVEGEPSAHDRFLVVDFQTPEVRDALGIDQDLDAVLLQHRVIVLFLVVKSHAIGETGATAMGYTHPEIEGFRIVFLSHHLFDLETGLLGQTDQFLSLLYEKRPANRNRPCVYFKYTGERRRETTGQGRPLYPQPSDVSLK